MSVKDKAFQLYVRLKNAYPDPKIELDYTNAFELLVATILSAQATDKLVNTITPELFKTYPTPESMSKASDKDIDQKISRVNFHRNKAKNLHGAATMLVEKFNGEVPKTMEELVQLPGVARKTANVVLGNVFNIPSGIVIDTHGIRLTNKLGLTDQKKADKIEKELMELLPQDTWINFGKMITLHGRHKCTARKHDCSDCPLGDLCPEYAEWHG